MPWLYRYTDLTDNLIKYNGIVYKDTIEALITRLKQHLNDFYAEDSKWNLYADHKFKIEVLDPTQVKTKNDAEMLEAHFIAVSKSWQYLNEAKKSWGKSSFITDDLFNWKLINDLQLYGDVPAYVSQKADLETEFEFKITTLELDLANFQKKYDDLLALYNKTVDSYKKQIAELTYKATTTKSDRIKDGLAKAKLAGKTFGLKLGTKLETKKQKQCVDIILHFSKDCLGSLSDSELIDKCGCSKNSYYKYKKLAKQQINQI